MPDTGLSRSPKLEKGALVQLIPDLIGVTPNVVTFQYNPGQLSHTVTPWNPFEVDQTQRGAQAPNVQPFEVRESFSLKVELDAADDLEDGRPIAERVGIAHRLAALQKMLEPSSGFVGDLIGRAQAIAGNAQRFAVRPTVPVILFVWGPGRVLPVRITSYEVSETLFSPTLHPLQADVSLGLEVLTPDVFKCQKDITAFVAIAAYQLTKTKRDALALAYNGTNADAIRGLLPF